MFWAVFTCFSSYMDMGRALEGAVTQGIHTQSALQLMSVHHNLPSRGVLAWARSGRLSVVLVLACLMYVLNLYNHLLCRALPLQVFSTF